MSTLTHQPGWVQARCQSSPTLITHKQQQTIFSSSPLSSSLFRAGWVQHANGSGTKHGVGKHTMRSRAAVGAGCWGGLGPATKKTRFLRPKSEPVRRTTAVGRQGGGTCCARCLSASTRSAYAPYTLRSRWDRAAGLGGSWACKQERSPGVEGCVEV